MAGIFYPDETAKLVTLTTHPNDKCLPYHRRMPMFILPENIQYWFQAANEQMSPLVLPIAPELITISKAN